MACFEDLPNETIAQICNYLPKRDLLTIIRCSYFYNFVAPLLYRKVPLSAQIPFQYKHLVQVVSCTELSKFQQLEQFRNLKQVVFTKVLRGNEITDCIDQIPTHIQIKLLEPIFRMDDWHRLIDRPNLECMLGVTKDLHGLHVLRTLCNSTTIITNITFYFVDYGNNQLHWLFTDIPTTTLLTFRVDVWENTSLNIPSAPRLNCHLSLRCHDINSWLTSLRELGYERISIEATRSFTRSSLQNLAFVTSIKLPPSSDIWFDWSLSKHRIPPCTNLDPCIAEFSVGQYYLVDICPLIEELHVVNADEEALRALDTGLKRAVLDRLQKLRILHQAPLCEEQLQKFLNTVYQQAPNLNEVCMQRMEITGDTLNVTKRVVSLAYRSLLNHFVRINSP